MGSPMDPTVTSCRNRASTSGPAGHGRRGNAGRIRSALMGLAGQDPGQAVLGDHQRGVPGAVPTGYRAPRPPRPCSRQARSRRVSRSSAGRAAPSGDTEPLQQVVPAQRIPPAGSSGRARSWGGDGRRPGCRPRAIRGRTPRIGTRHPARAIDVHHHHGASVHEGCHSRAGRSVRTPPVASDPMTAAASNTRSPSCSPVFVVVTLVLLVLVVRFTLQRAAAARSRWLGGTGGCRPGGRRGRRGEERRPITALVLAGGGTRGAIQIGMLQVLTEHGFVPDRIYGSSVGAINGVAFAGDPTRARGRADDRDLVRV